MMEPIHARAKPTGVGSGGNIAQRLAILHTPFSTQMGHQSMRHEYLKLMAAMLDDWQQVAAQVHHRPELLDRMIRPAFGVNQREDVLLQLELEHNEFMTARQILDLAKVVIFSQEQAEVFLESSRTYQDALEFKLPFPNLLLQFSRPIDIELVEGPDQMVGIVMAQEVITPELYQEITFKAALYKMHSGRLQVRPVEVSDVVNHIIPVFMDGNIRKLSWTNNGDREFFERSSDPALQDKWEAIRNLAVGCIGYINCQNVYLQRTGGADIAVNRKRAREGKKLLEAYYTCRLRGVSYDKQGRMAAEGGADDRHVSFRFDVRGHFRRLPTGKTTWVHPHQRGLDHELYIPKTYIQEMRHD